MSSLAASVSDTVVIARRSLKRIPRQPDLLTAYTVQPVMFVLLFVYVFGGAIDSGPFDYVDFLMPGIIVQSIAFGGFVTAIGLSDDVRKGLIDRFRSLPMSRAAVLTGRTFSDIVLNCLSLVVLFTVGFIAGFNFIDASAGEIVLGIVLVLLLGYAFSWIFALVGLLSSSPETANAIGFTVLFPLTFASSVFVPVRTMPDGLRQFAEANPFTTISDAMRSLWIGTPAHTDVWMSFVWCFALTAIFAPLAVSRYRRVAAR
jgi:ABC-2 type transport system permease protein